VSHGDRWLAAEGGRGGKGNARFLSNRRRAPSFAEQGEHAEEHWYRLEIRLMADVALVGFPNVGKSTFIAAISAAKPKIADYPFTTLQPNLGVVRLDDGFEMVVADIPGLVEGAAEGRGLGFQFLRHIERASALVIMVDLAETAGMDPDEQERVVLTELGDYQPELLDRPRVLVGSREDLAAEAMRAEFDGLAMSAVTGRGVPAVLTAMRNAVQAARDAHEEPDSWVVHRPAPEGFWIERADDASWVVLGRAAQRAVAFNDLTNPDALDEAHTRLKKLGVLKALAKKGVREGELVTIGRLAFDYAEDEVQRGS
jgi:GTP-binding protein